MYRDSLDMYLGATVVDSGDKTSPGGQRDNSRVEFQYVRNYKNNLRKCLSCGKKICQDQLGVIIPRINLVKEKHSHKMLDLRGST
jgi:hypothetical protein